MKLLYVYRLLILSSFVMFMFWAFFRDIYWENFDYEIQRLLMSDGLGNVLESTDLIFYSVMLASLVCYYGLLCMKKWAVWLLIFLDLVLFISLAPFAGVEISIPVERIAKTILLMADGAIIAIALFSELKSDFRCELKGTS